MKKTRVSPIHPTYNNEIDIVTIINILLWKGETKRHSSDTAVLAFLKLQKRFFEGGCSSFTGPDFTPWKEFPSPWLQSHWDSFFLYKQIPFRSSLVDKWEYGSLLSLPSGWLGINDFKQLQLFSCTGLRFL